VVKFLPLILVLSGTFIGAVATVLLKKATMKFRLLQIWRSEKFWLGCTLYGFSTIIYLFALRMDELSILYPIASTSYIWVSLFSVKYLGEKMNRWKWLALAGIIIGVTLIGLGH